MTENYVSACKPGEVLPPEQTKYILFGLPHEDPKSIDAHNCYAYSVESNWFKDLPVKHFIKVAQFGPYVGTFYNPQSIFAKPEDNKEYDASRGKFRFEFRQVPKSIFDLYIRFLATGNQATLLQANRLYEGVSK